MASGLAAAKCSGGRKCNEYCACHMEGLGVYLAREAKAIKYAEMSKEPIPGPDGGEDTTSVHRFHGAVIKCEVDLGHCKTATRLPCPHPHLPCMKPFVDHGGFWNIKEGFDSVYVPDNSLPATSTAEWCVADASRVKVLGFELHKF